jgi:Protein of unknown function (DUF2934)
MPKAKTPRNGSSTTKKITSITQGITQENRKASAAMNLQEEIRRRAYELFEERGRIPGYEHEDWLTAEREVVARHNVQTA